jgi:hypothetical protein
VREPGTRRTRLTAGQGHDRYSVVLRNLPFGLPMVPTVHGASSTPGDFRCLDAPSRIHLARLHRRGAHQTAQDSCPSREGTRRRRDAAPVIAGAAPKGIVASVPANVRQHRPAGRWGKCPTPGGRYHSRLPAWGKEGGGSACPPSIRKRRRLPEAANNAERKNAGELDFVSDADTRCVGFRHKWRST